jgi:catechol 2,3-dioxygenase-like lactoylglutathione lyase family enzyme
MQAAPNPEANITEVVPFLHVSNMQRSVSYYIEGLGFAMKHRWAPDGTLRWCWLSRGGASLMLQQFPTEGHDSWRPQGKVGDGFSLCFTCEDAVAFFHEVRGRGIEASEPQVGNSMWVTGLTDPDGFRLFFESATEVPEETKLSEVTGRGAL